MLSNGSSTPSNWVEKSFLGDHSDNGGAHPNGYQGKANDIGKLTLNWAVNTVNSLSNESIFRTPDASQQPSPAFVNLYNNYQTANDNFVNNLTSLNQVSAADFYNNIQNLNQATNQIKDGFVHSEVNIFKPWNWSIGSGRDTFYPNDQLKLRGIGVFTNQLKQGP